MTDAADARLARLAERCGVLPAYTDVNGAERPLTAGTRRALLAAMGVPGDSDDAVAEALAARETRAWRRILPPVLVTPQAAGPVIVPVSVPARHAARAWEYRLRCENGDTLDGGMRPAALPVAARREIDGEPVGRHHWALPALDCGYHELSLRCGGQTATTQLIVTPAHCFLPDALQGDGRVWGPALQPYALRSHRNWGIGDFTDLAGAVEFFAQAGAGTVGLGPLHSLYPHEPRHVSPYSPSSRLFWNVLYLDVEGLPGIADCPAAARRLADPAFRARIASAREAELLDPVAVASLKREILEPLFAQFRSRELAAGTPAAQAFRQFVDAGGDALREHALYEALAEHFHARDAGAWGWPAWPAGHEHPQAPAVRDFAARESERIEFFAWLQWLAERQLEAAARHSAELGLGVGLYLDLPLGADRGGSEVWGRPELFARGVSIGAPPDDFNLHGQNWGLPPWIPDALQSAAYAPFIRLLRRNMRHAGALRLDHVMGLTRLFWIPDGAGPADGGYVSYPLEDLLGILALESQRNRCAVIGEDLGTVPGELRDVLSGLGVLSNRLLYFEKRRDGEFSRPADMPRQALVAVANHDLPTLRGYWRGEDLALRERLDLFPDDAQREAQVVGRAQDRARLLFALDEQGLLPPGIARDPARVPDMTAPLAIAVHRYLARSPSMVLAFQMEDALGVTAQANLPGTTSGHPNWVRKLPLALEDWPGHPGLAGLLDGLRAERGSAAAAAPAGRPRQPVIPGATYRLQLNRDFRFADAERIVPYLARLGVTHVYLSPYLKARPGSTHGYDVTDHRSLNPEIGTRGDLDALTRTLRAAGLGQVADVVPNHMAVMGSDNAWWLDVLENGQASPYADYFDIDWQPVRPGLRDKLLIPVLGSHYGTALENGELRPEFDPGSGALAIVYYEHRLPLDPATYPAVLGGDLDALAARLGRDDPMLAEYLSVLRAFEQLPPRDAADPASRAGRRQEQAVAKRRLAELCAGCAQLRTHVETNLALLAGNPGEPASFARLHELMERQAWRVAWWQVAADEINYRRFFDINELAGLRVERPEVLRDTHALMIALYRDGVVDGLRIDHPDGLYDPADYFARLQDLLAGPARADAAAGDGPASARAYVLAEKILAIHEYLPETWPVYGTTGYDFAFLVSGLTVRPDAERELDRCYRRFTGERTGVDELVYACKKLVIRAHLSSELTTLANLLNRIMTADWQTRDFTLNSLRDALAEIVACFPVYRTYVSPDAVSAADRQHVEWAVSWARQRDPATGPELYEAIRRLLLLEVPAHADPGYRALAVRFAMKFQQYTAPVTAKALEDTCFYRYCRLVSLNEVGGDPRRFGVSVAAFHHNSQDRLRRWPHALLAGSTHDNKRSEDVRARLNVLTEMPGEWRDRIGRWRRLTRRWRRATGGRRIPARRDEYLYYQTLLGVWPLAPPDRAGLAVLCERLVAYMRKAVREAKEYSSWMRPDEDYEAGLEAFVRASLDPAGPNPFLAEMQEFAGRLAPFGLLNSLVQTALRLTAPGVPDLYQGNELWDFSLVDPDNRRAVDFGQREALLAELERALDGRSGTGDALLHDVLERLEDGRAKLLLTRELLHLRRARRDLFDHGEYLPLNVDGHRADHVCAFARRHADGMLVVVAGRWFAHLRAGRPGVLPDASLWGDTGIELPEGTPALRAVFGGAAVPAGSARVAASALLAPSPVAVLVSDA